MEVKWSAMLRSASRAAGDMSPSEDRFRTGGARALMLCAAATGSPAAEDAKDGAGAGGGGDNLAGRSSTARGREDFLGRVYFCEVGRV